MTMVLMIKSFSANLLIMVCSILFRGALVQAVQIDKVSPQQTIQNGTADIILDCQFTFDSTMDERLVLKWYHNSDPIPIYQWIPELGTRLFSPKIEPYVDKSYYIVDDTKTPYRAILLKKPTTNLSGRYTCMINSLHNHDSAETRVVIYAPARQFDININPLVGGINVSCSAHGLYPMPSLALYRYAPNNNSNPSQVTHETKTTIQGHSGQYSISLISIISDNYTSTDVAIHYECVLRIDDTEYSERRALAVQSGWDTRRSSNSSYNCKNMHQLSLMQLTTLLFLPLLAHFCII